MDNYINSVREKLENTEVYLIKRNEDIDFWDPNSSYYYNKTFNDGTVGRDLKPVITINKGNLTNTKVKIHSFHPHEVVVYKYEEV